MKPNLPSIASRELCGIEPVKLRPRFSYQELSDTLRALSLGPKACWKILKYDAKSSNEVFEHYVFLLAAIPCISGVIGHGMFGSTKLSVAMTRAAEGYVISILFFFGAIFLARKTAPLFGGEIAPERAAKLVVYSLTPFFCCGLALLVPVLSPLALAGTISVSYFLRGIRDMSRVPLRKQLTYGLLNVVCWILLADVVIRTVF